MYAILLDVSEKHRKKSFSTCFGDAELGLDLLYYKNDTGK